MTLRPSVSCCGCLRPREWVWEESVCNNSAVLVPGTSGSSMFFATPSAAPWAEMTWEVTLDSGETYGIVTFNKGEPPDHGSSPHFINRVTFHPENLSLQIDPVKKSDSGLYTLIIDTGGGRENRTKFRVSVFDRVRQPNIMVLSAHAELGQCNVTLSCSVPGADRVTYGWSRGTSWIPSDWDHQLHGHQSLLHVVINANSSDVFYRCNARNRASWATNTVDVKLLCDSPATGKYSSKTVPRNMGIARLDQTQAHLVQYHVCDSGQHQMPLEEERTLL
uniref:Ig-like domain-containing protein n=1 Tax=Chrysemys picta bellii TaxID=8478 RepID=A0A8C3IS50_CHRPI